VLRAVGSVSLFLSDDALLVGATIEDSGGSGWDACDSETVAANSGSVYVVDNTLWEISACIKSTEPYSSFGSSVDTHDGTYVIGQAATGTGAHGSAFVFYAPS
jgi:hypothetical protein